jgi:CheY-like chemotaxis protein
MKLPAVKTILIVDDELDVREALAGALEVNGYTIITAANGEEALKALAKVQKPDLVFLDLMMPVMDGFEFMKARNLIPGIMAVPIIVISAGRVIDSKIAGFSAEGYLEKPIDLTKLLQTAERYCG